jgi:hypothetical protein
MQGESKILNDMDARDDTVEDSERAEAMKSLETFLQFSQQNSDQMTTEAG